MKIRNGKKSDRQNFIITQKEAFPKLNIKRETSFFNEKVSKKEIFVLEEKGSYIGHISFSKSYHDPLFTDSVIVDELAIRKAFRSKGYGTLLMKKIVEYCKTRKIKLMYLCTADTKNNRAIKYYENLGFKKIGSIKNINPNSECDHNHLIYGVLLKDWRE